MSLRGGGGGGGGEGGGEAHIFHASLCICHCYIERVCSLYFCHGYGGYL